MKLPKGVSFEEKNLNTKDLTINPRAQRELKAKKVRDIVKDFNPLLVNPIKVSFRDGKYWVIDGQHTLNALRVVNDGDCMVRCKVFYGLTEIDEADLFLSQNGHSSPVGMNDKLRVLFLQGDQEVMDFIKATELAGLRIDFTKGQSRNKIIAISCAFSIYKKLPREKYIEMLIAIRDAWDGAPDSFSREILIGMSRVYATYFGEFKTKEMSKRLSKVAPAQIVREGKGYGSLSAPVMYAKAILRVYNAGRTTHRLDEAKL